MRLEHWPKKRKIKIRIMNYFRKLTNSYRFDGCFKINSSKDRICFNIIIASCVADWRPRSRLFHGRDSLHSHHCCVKVKGHINVWLAFKTVISTKIINLVLSWHWIHNHLVMITSWTAQGCHRCFLKNGSRLNLESPEISMFIILSWPWWVQTRHILIQTASNCFPHSLPSSQCL